MADHEVPPNPDDYDGDKLKRDIETCKESIDLNHWDFRQSLRTQDEKRMIMASTKKLLAAKAELESLLKVKDA